MRILFLGNTAVHASLLAANIYLRQVPDQDFRKMKGFADIEQDGRAYPVLVGKDRDGTEVYTLGAGRELAMTKKSLEQLRNILGCGPNDLVVKTVSLKGDNLLLLLNWLPPGWGRRVIHGFIARMFFKPQLPKLSRQIEDLKSIIGEKHPDAGGFRKHGTKDSFLNNS